MIPDDVGDQGDELESPIQSVLIVGCAAAAAQLSQSSRKCELVAMPSGDAQRAWFPEMLEQLQQYWSPDVSWDDFVKFCSRMTALRAEIRHTRGIKSPMMTCPACGERERAELLDISPRSALFALRKVGAISDEEMKSLDRAWAKHRKQNGLDAYGNQIDA